MATRGLPLPHLRSKSEEAPPVSLPRVIPELIFNVDRKGPFDSGYDPFEPESRWTDVYRGPVLRIISPSMELVMTYKKKKELTECDDSEGIFDNNCDNDNFCEATDPLIATPQCKQTRLFVLKNEGTTTIRYQWLRFPPSKAMRTMLANPRHYLNLDTPGNCTEQEQPASSSTSSSTLISDSSNNMTKQESRNAEFEKAKDIIGRKPRFLREASFDFHFREMPGILLPGQTMEMPIVYHPRQPGYCHENLYLLTHPRVSDEFDKTYMVRLTGFCMDSDWAGTVSGLPDSAVTGSETAEPESVKRTMNKTMLELSSADLIDSVLDHALYKKENPSVCTLPLGKLTREGIFYTHNPDLHYHFGVAERAIKTAQKLNSILIPGYTPRMEVRHLCPLSIKNLYYMLWDKRGENNKFATHLRRTKTEKLLRKLAKCNRILTRPPVFAYTNAGSREHLGCQVYLTAVFDEILEKMDTIKETFEESPMYKIQRGQLEEKYRQKILRDYYRTQQKKIKRSKEAETAQEVKESQEGEKPDSTPEERNAEPPTGAKTREYEKEISENANVDTIPEPAEAEIKPEGSPIVPKEVDLQVSENEEQEYDDSAIEVETDVEESGVETDTSRPEKPKKKSTEQGQSPVSEKLVESSGKKLKKKKSKEVKKTRSKKKAEKLEKEKQEKERQEKEKQEKEKKKESKTKKASLEQRKESALGEIEALESPEEETEEVEKPTVQVSKSSAEKLFEFVELEVEEMLRKRTDTKLKQARLIAFENMIGVGIERMMSIVDTMKNVYDYKSSDYFGQNPRSEYF